MGGSGWNGRTAGGIGPYSMGKIWGLGGPTLKVRSLIAPLCGSCILVQLRYPDPESLTLFAVNNGEFLCSRIRKTPYIDAFATKIP